MSTKDPRKLYPQPPYSGKEQTPPGNEEDMSPKADHGESSYEGTGRLEGRHALITGADSGIGRAVALAFAREGADVAISYLSEEKDARETERLVIEAGRKAVLLPGDIGEPSIESRCPESHRCVGHYRHPREQCRLSADLRKIRGYS